MLKLTKDEIYSICGNKLVERIYSYSDYVEFESAEELLEGGQNSGHYPNNTDFQFTMTGITSMQTPNSEHSVGYTGEGIKIGVIDGEFPDFENINVDYLDSNNIMAFHSLKNNLSNVITGHGSVVTYLIAGNYYNQDSDCYYYGCVPDAELYLADAADCDFADTDEYKYLLRSRLEDLVDDGVNVINSSLNMGFDGLNSYGDTAKWIDHIVSKHNISFVSSAGNSGSSGVTSGKFGFNSIAVGNCWDTEVLCSNSSYSNITNAQFKPDITAPGAYLTMVAFNRWGKKAYCGTSFAAPIVTGAIAQLCQASSALAVNPVLMKSVILAGSYIPDESDQSSVWCICEDKTNCPNVTTCGDCLYCKKIGDSINQNELIDPNNSEYQSFRRQFGSGIVNSSNSYRVLNSMCGSEITTAAYSFTDIENIQLNNEYKLIRVGFTWDRYTDIVGYDHLAHNGVPYWFQDYSFSVRTPSGVTYTKTMAYDNKCMISFITNRSGDYYISVSRIYGYNQGMSLSHGVSVSVQDIPNYTNNNS